MIIRISSAQFERHLLSSIRADVKNHSITDMKNYAMGSDDEIVKTSLNQIILDKINKKQIPNANYLVENAYYSKSQKHFIISLA